MSRPAGCKKNAKMFLFSEMGQCRLSNKSQQETASK